MHTQTYISFIPVAAVWNASKWKAWYTTICFHLLNLSDQTIFKSMGRWPWIFLIWTYICKGVVLTFISNISPKYIETNMQGKQAFMPEGAFMLGGTLISHYCLRSKNIKIIITLKCNYLREFTCFWFQSCSFSWSDWCFP